MLGTALRHRSGPGLVDVWVHPPAHRDVGNLMRDLKNEVHLVVVPRTGTRQAVAAILPDPDPTELRRIGALLPGTTLFAVPSAIATPAQREAAACTGARLRPGATTEQLLDEIRLLPRS